MDGQLRNGWGTGLHFLGVQAIDGFLARLAADTVNLSHPSAMAFVPGLGLIVREHGNGGRAQLFAVAMAAMSVMRTTWMATVLRFAIN